MNQGKSLKHMDFMKNAKENMEVLIFGECVQIFLIYSNQQAVIEKKVFCAYGGLSPNVDTIDDIRKFYRQQEVPIDGWAYE